MKICVRKNDSVEDACGAVFHDRNEAHARQRRERTLDAIGCAL